MRILIITLLMLLPLFGAPDEKEALKSSLRAEVYAQQLVDYGEYNKTLTFTEKALEKYPDNPALLMSRGTAFYNLKNLEDAKKFFVLSLEKEPTNEQAKDFIKIIDDQEAAKENPLVSDLTAYLSDNGMDFMLIFLAFLGGEIIARKYNRCTSHEIVLTIHKFLNRDAIATSWLARIKLVVSHYVCKKTFFSFCMVLELLVSLTIAATLLIVFLLSEFLVDITFFIGESLSTVSQVQLNIHILQAAGVLFALTVFLRFVHSVLDFERDPDLYAIALAEELEKLFAEQSYLLFYKSLDQLLCTPKFTPELRAVLLRYIHDDSLRAIIESKLNHCDLSPQE